MRSSSRASVSRSSRRVSRTSRFTSSLVNTHRDKLSAELTAKAEGKFFALMDLMATASREAGSLKEFWSRIIAERESYMQEREELLIQIDEVTETLQKKEDEHHHHGHELGEKTREVEKLLIELATFRTSVSEYKKKIAERDSQIDKVQQELAIIRETEVHIRTEYEKFKSEFESTQLKLVAVTDERDHAREDAERHHSDLRTIMREHTELKSKYTETLSKFEASRREVLTLNDRIKVWIVERDEYLHEKDKLHEELRKAKNRAEESSRELFEVHEKYQRVSREVTKLKEELRTVESERDELSHTIEHKNREIKNKSTGWDEAEERCADITLKYEHIKRELMSAKEKLREVEIERSELSETLERHTEEHRIVVIERDQLKDDLHHERTKCAESHRQVIVLQETLRRTESTLSDIRSEVHTLSERVKLLCRERDEARDKNGHLLTEITSLNEQISVLRVEITTITDARDHLLHELHHYKTRFEEMEETVTEYDDSSSEFRFEIESLRTMLREAREQKESAILASHSADRDRDDWRAKYEEKCRELERFEEEAAKMYRTSHSYGEGHGRTTSTRTRVVSSGTTVNNSG